jgi:hypothetical protein
MIRWTSCWQKKYNIRIVRDDEDGEEEESDKKPASASSKGGSPGVLVGK